MSSAAERRCRLCGDDIKHKRPQAKYCSEEHRNAHNYEVRKARVEGADMALPVLANIVEALRGVQQHLRRGDISSQDAADLVDVLGEFADDLDAVITVLSPSSGETDLDKNPATLVDDLHQEAARIRRRGRLPDRVQDSGS